MAGSVTLTQALGSNEVYQRLVKRVDLLEEQLIKLEGSLNVQIKRR